ncbi:PEP-CTERM sorting domain-containing protein [Roseateles sp. DC23W]|uniref:PEP-CTERM sorting domain-containing protein n=1 Tax=Pelomonas dachongensis TaxID=3299029 RepID=A0ABW7ENU7_9BURK
MIKKLLATGLLAAFSVVAQAQATLGGNLIVNGGAEAGVSGWTGFDGYPLFQSVDYGSNWVLPTQPGPADRGSKMFAGFGGQTAGFQVVELGVLAGQALHYDLSGWLGGWQTQGDNALLYVSFLDTVGNEIGFASIGPVMPADRGNQTGLFLRGASGLLPTQTTSLMFSLSMERQGGGDNDGYADNLSFVVTSAVPEGSTLAYLLAGLGLVGGVVVRRRSC